MSANRKEFIRVTLNHSQVIPETDSSGKEVELRAEVGKIAVNKGRPVEVVQNTLVLPGPTSCYAIRKQFRPSSHTE